MWAAMYRLVWSASWKVDVRDRLERAGTGTIRAGGGQVVGACRLLASGGEAGQKRVPEARRNHFSFELEWLSEPLSDGAPGWLGC